MLCQFDISKANLINGWMTENELLWLAEQSSVHKLIVEVGSFQGRSTRALADNTPGKVVAIDDWYGPREVDLIRDDFFKVFCENLADHIEAKKVIPWKINHNLVRATFEPDMVFIDGGHSYQECHRDIKAWLNAMKPGGLMCGHDADAIGVKASVSDLLPDYKVADGTTIWYAYIR